MQSFPSVPRQAVPAARLRSAQQHHPHFGFVNVGYHPQGRADHADGVDTEELVLVLDELLPEAVVGPNDGPAGPDPGVGSDQRHGVVLHEVGHADGDRAAHPSHTVQQRSDPAPAHAADPVSDGIEAGGDAGDEDIRHRDVQVLDAGAERVVHLQQDVDDGADAAPGVDTTVCVRSGAGVGWDMAVPVPFSPSPSCLSSPAPCLLPAPTWCGAVEPLTPAWGWWGTHTLL